jgi:uncharacterized membrane protein
VELAQRKTLLALGAALAFLPVIVWFMLPVAVVLKLAVFLRLDERLLEAYCFLLGAILEFVAVYFFQRARRRPWDWLSICAVITGAFSICAIIVFWGAIAAVTLHGW